MARIAGKYSIIAQTKIAKKPTSKMKSINWLIKYISHTFIIAKIFSAANQSIAKYKMSPKWNPIPAQDDRPKSSSPPVSSGSCIKIQRV